jgi:hypothetical protein
LFLPLAYVIDSTGFRLRSPVTIVCAIIILVQIFLAEREGGNEPSPTKQHLAHLNRSADLLPNYYSNPQTASLDTYPPQQSIAPSRLLTHSCHSRRSKIAAAAENLALLPVRLVSPRGEDGALRGFDALPSGSFANGTGSFSTVRRLFISWCRTDPKKRAWM